MINRAEQLVTVFGGGGFIGRYVCEFLLRRGVRVRVASRDPRSAYFIQPLGQVGQIGYVQADITRRDTVEHALDGASGTVNLCGVFGRAMRSVHVDGARNVAEVAAAAGLREGDEIVAVDGRPVTADYYRNADWARGAPGTAVALRRGDGSQVTVTLRDYY